MKYNSSSVLLRPVTTVWSCTGGRIVECGLETSNEGTPKLCLNHTALPANSGWTIWRHDYAARLLSSLQNGGSQVEFFDTLKAIFARLRGSLELQNTFSNSSSYILFNGSEKKKALSGVTFSFNADGMYILTPPCLQKFPFFSPTPLEFPVWLPNTSKLLWNGIYAFSPYK